jgi:hypothetical protein
MSSSRSMGPPPSSRVLICQNAVSTPWRPTADEVRSDVALPDRSNACDMTIADVAARCGVAGISSCRPQKPSTPLMSCARAHV